MSGRASVATVGFLSTLAWAGVGLTVLNLKPSELASRALFFTLLYVALLTTLGLAAYALSFRLFAAKAIRGNLGHSLQQGGLWASFAIATAALQMLRMLTWVNGALLLGLLIVAQFLMLARQHPNPRSVERARRRWEETKP